ncbi:hypothetical protein ACFE04_028555 [Oxalis oulophora]
MQRIRCALSEAAVNVQMRGISVGRFSMSCVMTSYVHGLSGRYMTKNLTMFTCSYKWILVRSKIYGQKLNVIVITADKKTRMLILYMRLIELKLEAEISSYKVVRMWEPLFGKQQFPSSLELAVMDCEGTRMWCTIPQLMIKSVKMKVKENGVYVLHNFFVGLSTVKPNQTRVSAQKYKINFQQNTSIIATDDHDFPPTLFDIRSCTNVLNRNGVNEVDLIDVLGLLVTKHDIVPFSIEGKPHRRLTIVLQDLEKNTIECTLWDSYIDELFNKVDFEGTEPVIILLQFCQAKIFKGQMIITNTRHSETKMWINSDISVINDFKKSLSGDDGDASSQLITTVSSTQSETLVDDLMSSPVRSIEELLTLEEGAIVWLCGTVMGIVPSDKWCYLGCRKCSKAVRKDGNKFYCRSYNTSQTKANERYVVETNVVDSTAPISDGNVSSFPAELELICGRKFLFKIHKKSASNSSGELTYHVMKITDDKNLLTKFVIPPSDGVSDEKPYVIAEETPCSKSQESIGDTISKDCTPAKRLFPTPAMDDDSHNASATKVPKIMVKVEK